MRDAVRQALELPLCTQFTATDLTPSGRRDRHNALYPYYPLNASRVGFTVTAYVEVSLVNPSGADMTAFERRMQRCPEVTQCSEIAGEVDYLLTVVARDMPEFAEFTRWTFSDDERIRAYRSLLVLRQTKNEHTLPL